MTFRHDGCVLRISVVPKSEKIRGVVKPGDRAVGGIIREARWVDSRTALREAIKKKARRYGPVRRPLVVAVNGADQRLDRITIMEGLFGQETYSFCYPDGFDEEPMFSRALNGAWVGPRGPINTRVSAVFVVSSLLPWTVNVREPAVYHNPWARNPCQEAFHLLHSYRHEGSKMALHKGVPIGDVLGVPSSFLDEP